MGLLEQAASRVEVESVPLRELSRKSAKGRTLAVCESPTGAMFLMRERIVGKVGADGKRNKSNGTEKMLKRTSDLADIAVGIEVGLL